MLSHVGLKAGTGMECHYGGGFGQFRGKLDHAWHIQGIYRWEAEQFLEGVLSAVDPEWPSKASSSLSVHSTQASSTLSLHVLQHMKQDPEKKTWIDVGCQRGYKWPRCYEIQSCNVVVCPVDGEQGTVLVCTSGDPKTKAQAHLTCQMLHYLGWKPHIIVGVGQADMPPKRWKVGCKATFEWYV